jgi:hypothetical protein
MADCQPTPFQGERKRRRQSSIACLPALEVVVMGAHAKESSNLALGTVARKTVRSPISVARRRVHLRLALRWRHQQREPEWASRNTWSRRQMPTPGLESTSLRILVGNCSIAPAYTRTSRETPLGLAVRRPAHCLCVGCRFIAAIHPCPLAPVRASR